MPVSSVARTVLNEIGWDEGITIPVANEENKLLEDEASSVDLRQLTIAILYSFIYRHMNRV